MDSGSNQDIRGVWGSSASDVFAVGNGGTILHYDGNEWSPMVSGTSANLLYVWGTSPSDVFVTGASGTILHYDGTNWNSMSSGTTVGLWSIWGDSSSNVYIVGDAGSVLLYDGSVWTSIVSGTNTYFRGIWGSSASDIIAVGHSSGGQGLYYDGNSWQSISIGGGNLNDVWGTITEKFAVGYGTIAHFDGSTWTSMSSGTSQDIRNVWGQTSTDIFAVGAGGVILHYNGSAWANINSGTSLEIFSLWGSPDNQIYAVGASGTILHFDASTSTPSVMTELGVEMDYITPDIATNELVEVRVRTLPGATVFMQLVNPVTGTRSAWPKLADGGKIKIADADGICTWSWTLFESVAKGEGRLHFLATHNTDPAYTGQWKSNMTQQQMENFALNDDTILVTMAWQVVKSDY